MNNSYLEKCRHSKSEPYCPILVIGEILKQAEPDPAERKAMLMKVVDFSWIRIAT